MYLGKGKKNRILCAGLVICLTLSMSTVWDDISNSDAAIQTVYADELHAGSASATDASKDSNESNTSGNTSGVSFNAKKEQENEKATANANKNTAQLLVDDIKKVNDRIAETTQKIEDINSAITRLDGQISESERALIEAEDNIKEARFELGDSLKLMYESSEGDDLLSALMRADDEVDLLNRGEYISDFNKYVNGKISDLQRLMNEQEEKTEELINLRNDREEELIKYEERKTELSQEMKELSSLMEDAKKKAEDAETLAKELATEVAALEAKEREVLGNRKYSGESSKVVYDGDGTDYYYVTAYPYTDEDVQILAAIIQAEAGGTSYPGMIAVGSVVMNRVENAGFPNTVAGVIYDPYQFEPVQIGTFAVILAEGPVAACYQAAQEVLEGKRNVPNLYFKAAWYAEQNGISGVNIGGNVFH